MSVGTEPRPIQLPLPGGSPGATVRVHPISTAEQMSPPAFIEREGGRTAALKILTARKSQHVPLPVPAYLVEHPTAGAILIDTGLHTTVLDDKKANLGRLGARLFDIRTERGRDMHSAVGARGIDPTAVTTVIMTHLHYDHAGGVVDFPQATFVVDRREWNAASERGGWKNGYKTRLFDHAFDWQAIDYDDESVGSFATFAHGVDLFGDGSIRLVATPGHTLGHQSVILRLRDRELVACGDAVYTRRTLEGDAMPFLTADEHRFCRALKEIQRYVEHTPTAVVIPGHDWRTWGDVEAVYE